MATPSKLEQFNELSIENIICFNLMKILKEPYYSILVFLSKEGIKSADIVAIRKHLNNPQTSEKNLKMKIRQLVNQDLVKEDAIKSVFSSTSLGKIIISLFHKNNLDLTKIPNMSYFLQNLSKIIILSRLSYEEQWISAKNLLEKYIDLARNKNILNYLVEKEFAIKNKSTNTYKITQIGKDFINFYWSLYNYYTTEHEAAVLAGKPSDAAQISFSPFLINFNFSSLDAFNYFLLISRVIQDNSLSKGILRKYSKLTTQKLNQLTNSLINLQIFAKAKKGIVTQDKNYHFFENFREISKNQNYELMKKFTKQPNSMKNRSDDL